MDAQCRMTFRSCFLKFINEICTHHWKLCFQQNMHAQIVNKFWLLSFFPQIPQKNLGKVSESSSGGENTMLNSQNWCGSLLVCVWVWVWVIVCVNRWKIRHFISWNLYYSLYILVLTNIYRETMPFVLILIPTVLYMAKNEYN